MNPTLPLIITATIVNHYVKGILVDDRSSCNLIYFKILTELGLRKQELRLCYAQILLAFNDSSTLMCGQTFLRSLGKMEMTRGP